jgi:hypothetical protein
MKHKQANQNKKRDEARKMMTAKEISQNIPVFDSEAWAKRKASRLGKELSKLRMTKMTPEERSRVASLGGKARVKNYEKRIKTRGSN